MARSKNRAESQQKPEERAAMLPRRFVELGILVAFLPAWAILLAYLYERGYAGVFGIDKGYIQLTTASIAAIGL